MINEIVCGCLCVSCHVTFDPQQMTISMSDKMNRRTDSLKIKRVNNELNLSLKCAADLANEQFESLNHFRQFGNKLFSVDNNK